MYPPPSYLREVHTYLYRASHTRDRSSFVYRGMSDKHTLALIRACSHRPGQPVCAAVTGSLLVLHLMHATAKPRVIV